MSYQGKMPLEFGKPQQVEGEKMVLMNAIFAWQTKGTRNRFNNLGN
jgi:hypothetical protein